MLAHYGFLILVVIYIIFALFMELFQCTGPPELKFSLIARGSHSEASKCLDGNKLGYSLAIIHSTMDFALLTVPLIVLYQMQMSTRKKIKLGFLFSIGALSCIGSVMRQVVQTRIIDDIDFTWSYREELSWIIVDIFFGMVAASLPVLNAALPKSWRASSNQTPQLGRISVSKSDHTNSVKLDSKDNFQRPDGTVSEGVDDVEKDSFHTRTEERWDNAFVQVQKTESVQRWNGSERTESSDDTLL